jgi:trehalose 6-phosphate phosphatase
MRYLLAKRNLVVLRKFSCSQGVLGFDYDGTLAPIVTDRDRARMSPRTRALLTQVCRLYPCAVISGRSSREVRAFLGNIPFRHVLGNHGIEPGPGLARFKSVVVRARKLLQSSLSNQQGVEIEDKTYSLSVHYRRSRQRSKACLAIERAIACLPFALRTVPGKCVINLLPKQAKSKGDALLAIRKCEHADTALFFGDDDTDEDVFRLDQPGRITTVRIGYSRDSAAAYYLRRQSEIDGVLRYLIEARSGRSQST